MIASELRKLSCFLDGEPRLSESRDHFDIFDPSTGQVIAQAPDCTEAEVNAAVETAREAFPAWAEMPAMKRVQILFHFRDMIEANLSDLTRMVATEHGKVWDEAQGDVLKAKEVVEGACGIPSLMQGKSMMNASAGYDTTLYHEPLGVFVGISPFNFPAMIPMGWMMPLCIGPATRWCCARPLLLR